MRRQLDGVKTLGRIEAKLDGILETAQHALLELRKMFRRLDEGFKNTATKADIDRLHKSMDRLEASFS